MDAHRRPHPSIVGEKRQFGNVEKVAKLGQIRSGPCNWRFPPQIANLPAESRDRYRQAFRKSLIVAPEPRVIAAAADIGVWRTGMLESLRKSIVGINTSHQLALGATIGAAIGLLPKDSAIPWLLGLVLLLSRGNLLTGMLAAIVMSMLSPLLDLHTDRIGMAVLSAEAYQDTFAKIYSYAWMPWTRLNNSVVMGNLILAVMASLPFYIITRIGFAKIGIPFLRQCLQSPMFDNGHQHPDSRSNTPGEVAVTQ